MPGQVVHFGNARPHSGNGSVLQMKWSQDPHSVSAHEEEQRGMMRMELQSVQ